MTVVAALFAGLAVWLLLPGASRRAVVVGNGTDGARRWLERARRRWGSGRRDAERRGRRATVAALAALAAELRSGQPPATALRVADPTGAVWPSAIAAATYGADIADALRADAHERSELRSLAACWEVSAQAGAGFEAAVDRLAQAARIADDIRGQLDVQLAGPRATGRLLALLPLIGIALGELAGADGIGWLLGSPLGLACLVLGVGLDVLGFVWTSRIAARLEAEL